MKILPLLAFGIAYAALIVAPGAAFAGRPDLVASSPDGGQVVDLPRPGGGHQRILYQRPARPRATLIMLPGGAGDIDIGPDGTVGHGRNFVVRTRARWVARGYAVLIPDSIDQANLRGARHSPGYARLVDDLAAYARDRANAPVFLLGTSQGSIAAMNGAAHARPGSIGGVILTESVSVMGHSGETVFDADPQDVRVPALIVANRDDRCDVAPPTMAPRIAAAMRRSPDVRVLTVAGGIQRSGSACGSLSPHGYYGIEARVITAIIAWLRGHGG